MMTMSWMRKPSRVLFAAALLLMCARNASAEHFVTPDTPSPLGGTMWEPNEIVRNDAGSFSLERALPAGTPLDATHRMDSGDWLLSVSEPAMLGGQFYDPRDVVRYDGSAFAMYFDGAAAGVPAVANVDAAFLAAGTGDLVLSFDVPVTIGANTYEPADLVLYHAGSFSLFFDASSATPPIPPSTNVLDADQRGGRLYLSFDVPTRLGATTFLPGQIVSWSGSAFSVRFQTPGWPEGSAMTGLALGSCLDDDGDRFGEPGDARCGGGAATDCDDARASVLPGGAQTCGDLLNNDCSSPSWPSLAGTNESDDDADGRTECAGDCNDADPGALAAPLVVDGLDVALIPGGQRYTWMSQSSSSGTGTLYDVFWGSIGMLGTSGDFSTGICRIENLPNAVFDDGGVSPGAGEIFYFLFRAQNSCATGSWGTVNRDTTAAGSGSPCQ